MKLHHIQNINIIDNEISTYWYVGSLALLHNMINLLIHTNVLGCHG
jgi:hypothetical protein